MRKIWVIIMFIPYMAFLQSKYPNDGIIIEYSGNNITSLLEKFNATRSGEVKVKRLGINSPYYLLQSEDGTALLDYCKGSREILNITPNSKVENRLRPNDTRINQQYYLELISAYQAWEITTGGENFNNREIVIGVIDDGYNINHEDLKDNIYINTDEIPEDNKDNDGNSYVDDISGWNTRTNSFTHDIKSHGTNILGVLGARGNNQKGIAGINWQIKLLPVTTGNFVSDVIEGYEYLRNEKNLYLQSGGAKGANIVVSSYSGGLNRAFAIDYPIWCGMYDKLGTQGILNVAATTNDAVDIEEVGDMPGTCTSPFLLIVNSTDQTDELDAVTGYGKVSVDISAPGDMIITTDLVSKGVYKTESGTSLSTPMVAGAAGLMYAVKCEAFYNLVSDDPSGAALEVKKAIMENTDAKTTLSNKTVSGGRLNIFKAMNGLIEANCDKALSPKGPLSVQSLKYFNKQLSINYISPDSKPLELKIFDSIGKLCYKTEITPPVFGEKTAVVDIPIELPGLLYFAALLQGEEISGRGFSAQHY